MATAVDSKYTTWEAPSTPAGKHRSSGLSSDNSDDSRSCYHDPTAILEESGPSHIGWYAIRCCLPPLTAERIQIVAKFSLNLIVFFIAVSQWSILGSSVAFFNSQLGVSEDEANALMSAVLSFCFVFCIAGGILSDGKRGSLYVLYLGLGLSMAGAGCATIFLYPISAFQTTGVRVIVGILLFVFAAGIGLCQSATGILIGDQARQHVTGHTTGAGGHSELQSGYNIYYIMIQLGAFLSRVFYPWINNASSWFVGIATCVFLPLAIALSTLITHSGTMVYRLKQVDHSHHSSARGAGGNPVVKSIKIVLRRVFCRETYEELGCYHTFESVRDTKRTLRVLKIHLPLPFFWALYFQMFGLWYLQAKDLNRTFFGQQLSAEQVTAAAPFFDVICLVLLHMLTKVLRNCCNVSISPRTRIQVGYIFAVVAFGCATVLQHHLEVSGNSALHGKASPNAPSVLWQIPQFLFICAAEVFVYPAALQISYANSPPATRGFAQSALWLFIGLGNIINIILVVICGSSIKENSKMPVYFIYCGLMSIATLLYAWLVAGYDDLPIDVAYSGQQDATSRGASTNSLFGQKETTQSMAARGGHGINSSERSEMPTSSSALLVAGGSESSPLLRPTKEGSIIAAQKEGSAMLSSTPPSGSGTYAVPGGAKGGGSHLLDSTPRGGGVEVRRYVAPREGSGGSQIVYHSTRKTPRSSV